MTSKNRRFTTGLAAVAVSTVALTGLGLSAAQATGADQVGGIVGDTGGKDIHVRPDTRSDSISRGALKTGAKVVILCQEKGRPVTNPQGFTSDIWSYSPQLGGYVADAYLKTGYDGMIPGMNDCAAPVTFSTGPVAGPQLKPGADSPGKSGRTAKSADKPGASPSGRPVEAPKTQTAQPTRAPQTLDVNNGTKRPTSTPTATGRPPKVDGVPKPCVDAKAYPNVPADQFAAAMEKEFGIKMVDGDQSWKSLKPEVRQAFWNTFSSIKCTGFVDQINKNLGRTLVLKASSITETERMQQQGREALAVWDAKDLRFDIPTIERQRYDQSGWTKLIVHELVHPYDQPLRGTQRAWWDEFTGLNTELGGISEYGGTKDTENLAEVAAFYVARCEIDRGRGANPYDDPVFRPYYDFARDTFFNGHEFGPKPGQKCG